MERASNLYASIKYPFGTSRCKLLRRKDGAALPDSCTVYFLDFAIAHASGCSGGLVLAYDWRFLNFKFCRLDVRCNQLLSIMAIAPALPCADAFCNSQRARLGCSKTIRYFKFTDQFSHQHINCHRPYTDNFR